MPGYLVGTLAGVDLTGCKNLVVDAGSLRPDHTGVARYAADGSTVVVQTIASIAGQPIGIQLDFAVPANVDSIVTAINSAMNGGSGSFEIDMSDDAQTVAGMFIPDYTVSPSWVNYPPQRVTSTSLKSVVFRVVRVAAAP